MGLPQSAVRKSKSLATSIFLLGLSGCAVLGTLGLYSSWQGHHIDEFIAQVGQPTESGKRLLGSGNTYTWRGCRNTGRIISYQQGYGGPVYSEREQSCTKCTAYTDVQNKILSIDGRCP